MSDSSRLTLTLHLQAAHRDDAVRLLRGYYAGLIGTGMGFEGGWWDGFDPSGTRQSSPDTFTADDLLSASLLSAPIHPTALLAILNQAQTLSAAIRKLGDDRDLAGLTNNEVRTLEMTSNIWQELRSIPFIGPTRASKLIARKRPRLIPVYDSVIGSAVYRGTSRGQWTRLHAALTANDDALQKHLHELRTAADLPDEISPLRIFDVIAWLDGSGKAADILVGR